MADLISARIDSLKGKVPGAICAQHGEDGKLGASCTLDNEYDMDAKVAANVRVLSARERTAAVLQPG
jgi:hypothetical protein